MTPIFDKNLSDRLYQILVLQLADNQLRWVLNSDSSYTKIKKRDDENSIDSQEVLERYVNKIYNKINKRSRDYVKRLTEKLLQES